MRERYDFVFAGGGLAGLSLALHLAHSSLRGASMLIVDRDAKQRNDRTWCFWTNRPTLFDSIVHREWDHLQFVGQDFQQELVLSRYRYKMIRGLDLYRFAREQLGALPDVEFAQGTIRGIEEGTDGARIHVNGERVQARWLFDSRFDATHFRADPTRYHTLRQYFQGWLVETPQPTFEPQCATLMDFRTPQENEMRFFYVLPLTRTRALVEFVTASPTDYDRALDDYLESVLQVGTYRILETEGGVNPMSDYVFPRRASAHVMNIGTRGGRGKPSSGYAFMRIQDDSAAIVQSLERFGDPFQVPADSSYYRLCDTLMLDVMQRHGEQIKPLFTALFKNNPVERVLHFLDQAASPLENLAVIASLPPPLFLQALFRRSLSPGFLPDRGPA